MEEVEIVHLGNVKFEAVARGHRVVCDQPPANGGQDTGMTPPEFLLASLGTCAGFYAAQYLKTRSLPAEGLKIKVTAEKMRQPARLDRFQMSVTTPDLDPKDQAGVLRAVRSCLIHATLLNKPEVDIVLNAPVETPAS